MPWAGGNYTKGNNGTGGWTGDASLGIGIEAGRHDTQDNDFATGINQCLNKDGSNAATGDLNLGGFRPVNVAAGTAAAPAICAGGDTNTGMYSAAADNLGFSTAGIGRLWIDNAGNIGAGTASPLTRISVVGVGVAGGVSDSGSKLATLRVADTGGSGNNGGAVEFGSGYGSYAQSYFAAIKGLQGSGSGNTTGDLAFYTRNATGDTSLTERMRIDNAGNIGAGTDSPLTRISVVGVGVAGGVSDSGSKLATLRVSDTGGSTNNGGAVEFGAGYGSYAQSYFSAIKGLLASGAGNTTGDLAFYTRNATGDTSLTERMRIDDAGNININGASAVSRLYVKGETATNTRFALALADSAAADLFNVRCDGRIITGAQTLSPYNNTTASAANMFVTSGGELQRSTSSLRYKTDVHDYTKGLAAVMALRPVFYKGINDGEKQFAGLIAEEVHDAGLSEFVVYNDEGQPDALQYSNMIALALKAIQELNAKLDALTDRVMALEV